MSVPEESSQPPDSRSNADTSPSSSPQPDTAKPNQEAAPLQSLFFGKTGGIRSILQAFQLDHLDTGDILLILILLLLLLEGDNLELVITLGFMLLLS